jgi:glucan endo-1,3-beta-D-glucosidase
MRSSALLAIAASLSAVSGLQGFNYGATKADGYTIRQQSDFEGLFQTAKNLVGTNNGFTSARLYTMVQGGTTADVTSAIPAAIAQGTHLLLGLWASGPIENEIAALKTAIAKYGSAFTSLVAGISVGSEDLYRNSPTGIAAGSNIGADPATVVDYIKQVRTLISGTGLSGVPVGHVDTWTAWVNGSNQAVIDNCDFIGFDGYPYYQNTDSNSIDSAKSLFEASLAATQNAVGGKPIWITETGWPVSGPQQNLATASLANAKTYWDVVGCPRFGNVNVFWFTLEDTDNGATPKESFGVTTLGSTTPLYDLSCSNISSSSSSSVVSSTATSTKSGSGTATTGTGASISSAASVSSAASAASSAASAGDVASSGSGLSPSKGVGSGYGSGSNATATPTGSSSGGSSSSGNATGLSTTLKPTATGTSSSSGSTSTGATVSTGAASAFSGSVVGVMGAVFAALAVL